MIVHIHIITNKILPQNENVPDVPITAIVTTEPRIWVAEDSVACEAVYVQMLLPSQTFAH